MNARQQRFCELYALTMNATQSALQAGYKKESAYSQGSRLLKNKEIQECIKKEIKKLDEDIPDKSEIKRYWARIMRDNEQKESVRMTASMNLAKALFMFNSDISYWDD